LNRPSLSEAAAKFRESHRLWLALAEALLPAGIPLLHESKELIQKKHHLFIKEGEAALPEIREINARLQELLAHSETGFPLSALQAADLREHLRDILLQIRQVEQDAVQRMQHAIL
jgi:hypothetical protein